MDNKLTTLATFIDFRKAFDCVQHPTLLRKLSNIGLHPDVLKWLQSNLSNRRQRVLANNTYSSYQEITQGVPQGSVLGPLFYIIYANDIVSRVRFCNIALYADDTVLYLARNNFVRTVTEMQSDMDALTGWCRDNGIQMNIDKTSLMLFGSVKRIQELPPFEVTVNNVPLSVMSSYRYLGVTVDSQLNYNKQVQKIISKVSLKLKQFRQMRYLLNTKAAVLVYKNMILPMLEYGDIFLVGATAENRKKLQILQNKGLRCALSKDRYASVTDLHEEARLLRSKSRREQHLLSYMYDMSQIGTNLKGERKVGVRTRSQNKKLMKIKKPHTEKFKRSLAYRGPNWWNRLPDKLHHVESRSLFNARLKSRLTEREKKRNEEMSS